MTLNMVSKIMIFLQLNKYNILTNNALNGRLNPFLHTLMFVVRGAVSFMIASFITDIYDSQKHLFGLLKDCMSNCASIVKFFISVVSFS